MLIVIDSFGQLFAKYPGSNLIPIEDGNVSLCDEVEAKRRLLVAVEKYYGVKKEVLLSKQKDICDNCGYDGCEGNNPRCPKLQKAEKQCGVH